jgi:hypothetical protein
MLKASYAKSILLIWRCDMSDLAVSPALDLDLRDLFWRVLASGLLLLILAGPGATVLGRLTLPPA